MRLAASLGFFFYLSGRGETPHIQVLHRVKQGSPPAFPRPPRIAAPRLRSCGASKDRRRERLWSVSVERAPSPRRARRERVRPGSRRMPGVFPRREYGGLTRPVGVGVGRSREECLPYRGHPVFFDRSEKVALCTTLLYTYYNTYQNPNLNPGY